ncbi:MAG: tRNA (adenosine(37)-N6)-dimethylallyltransferase MiaA [Alistipes sp.]|nr:tRNA (adenosine(37)-N6)-dimethylallyltransferase MiaA [Alistipes sp.]
MMSGRKRLIVIVGATGSGKTDLSIAVAEHFAAPIISTDSRQFYRGMAIGTAQPSREQMARVEHHLVDCLDVSEEFNCGAYERVALERLSELFQKYDTVVAVGGSGLYIKALCEGMDDLPDAEPALREELLARLETEGLESLVEQLRELDEVYYNKVDRCNPQRVLRALEVCLTTGRPYSLLRSGGVKKRDFEIVKVGIDYPREELYDRINRRVDMMMTEGLESEARAMLPYRHLNALQTVGFSEMFDYFDGKISREEAVELIKRNSRRYAKRQMTWFRRDKDICWFEKPTPETVIAYLGGAIGH